MRRIKKILITWFRTRFLPIDNATKWVIAEYAKRLAERGYSCLIATVGEGGLRRMRIGSTYYLIYEIPECVFYWARLYKFLVWHTTSRLLKSITIAYYLQRLFTKLPLFEELVRESDVVFAHDLESAVLLSDYGNNRLLYLAHDIYGCIVQEEGCFYQKPISTIEKSVVDRAILATLSYYDKFQFEKLYGVHAHYLGLGPINYLDYGFTKTESDEDIELPDEYVLVFATKGLERKVFFLDERRYALQNLILAKILSRFNYPIVVIGKESHIVVRMLHNRAIGNVIAIGYVSYKKYLEVLQKARVIALSLFGWRSGVSIKLLDTLSYGNVVITSYAAVRAFPQLSKAPFIARSFKDLIEKINSCIKSETMWTYYSEWLDNYRRRYLIWDEVIKRFEHASLEKS